MAISQVSEVYSILQNIIVYYRIRLHRINRVFTWKYSVIVKSNFAAIFIFFSIVFNHTRIRFEPPETNNTGVELVFIFYCGKYSLKFKRKSSVDVYSLDYSYGFSVNGDLRVWLRSTEYFFIQRLTFYPLFTTKMSP